MTLPKDHPDGPKPVMTKNVPSSLKFMADEAKVLIIFDHWLNATKAMKFFSSLPKESYVVHRGLSYGEMPNSNNSDVAAWVRSLQCPIKKNDTMEETSTKKFLISNWYTAAGFEAPAVIFVTDFLSYHPSFATNCMRAKAKLVVCSL